MAIITPTFSLKSNSSSASGSAGPLSMALATTLSDNLSVDTVKHFTVANVLTTVGGGNSDLYAENSAGQVLVDGSTFTASSHSDGTTLDHHGCWLLIVNTTATTSNHVVAIGHTTDADVGSGGFTALVDGNNNTHADANQRLFSLRAGEFAWFPYDFTGDLYCQATGANQSLEVWRFDTVE